MGHPMYPMHSGLLPSGPFLPSMPMLNNPMQQMDALGPVAVPPPSFSSNNVLPLMVQTSTSHSMENLAGIPPLQVT